MKQQKHKGFTLVELLVVIAILAVLATVSIVGYTSFINKARVSNDLSLITQINTGLEAAEIGAKKPATLHDVRPILADMGFDLPKLTPSAAGHNYVWNYETNRFLLIKDNKEVVAPDGAKLDESKSFVVAHNLDELNKWQGEGFSIYLADDFKLESGDAITVNTGIDLGNCTAINAVTYENSPEQSVIIRTNSTNVNLVIKAENDTINLHGIAGVVDVQAIKSDSLHLFGTVETLKLTKGHVVLENNSHVEYLQIVNDTTATATIAPATNGSKGTIGLVLRPASSSFTVENGDGIEYISGEYHGDVKPEDLSGTISGGVYQLGEDVNVTSSFTVGAGQTVIMQLSDTATISNTINNNGELVVVGGTVESTTPGSAAICNAQGATATLRDGTYKGSAEAGFYVIQNQGTMILENTTIIAEGTGSSCIANGWDEQPADSTQIAELTIMSGTFSGGLNALKNDYNGKVVINGGTFQNSVGNTVMNWGEMVINGGEFTFQQPDNSTLSGAIHATFSNHAQATINGGTFTMNATSANTSTQSSYTVFNGAVYSNNTYIANGTPTLTINNGTFSVAVTEDTLLQVNGQSTPIYPVTNIYGGEFVNENGYKIFTRNGSAMQCNPIISGGKFTVKNNKNMDTDFIQMADGKYLCAENSLKELEVVSTMPDETYKLNGKVYSSRDVWAVAYLKDNDGKITYYETLKEAVTAVNRSKDEDGVTLVILQDIVKKSTDKVPAFTTSLTLDLNGHEIYGKKVNTIEAKCKLTITDSSSDHSGEVRADSQRNIIYANTGAIITLEGGNYLTGIIKYGNNATITIKSGCTFGQSGTSITVTKHSKYDTAPERYGMGTLIVNGVLVNDKVEQQKEYPGAQTISISNGKNNAYIIENK